MTNMSHECRASGPRVALAAVVLVLSGLAPLAVMAQGQPRDSGPRADGGGDGQDFSSRRRGETAEDLRRRLEPVLRLEDDELLRLIPERSGLNFVGCPNPNCRGGTQEGQLAWTL